MQSGGLRYCDWGTIVPFILSASVQIDVGFAAYHRHRLCACGSHGHQFSAKNLGHGYCLCRRACAANQHTERVVRRPQGNWTVRAQSDTHTGKCYRSGHGNAAKRQCHMHRPVVSALTILARSIKRIDDPDTLNRATVSAVLFLFGQQCIVRSRAAQGFAQIAVGPPVPFIAQCRAVELPRILQVI